jgi:hypothetical protein
MKINAISALELADDLAKMVPSEDDHDASGADKKLTTPTPTIGEYGADDSAAEGNDVLAAVVEESGTVVRDSGSLEHLWIVV